MSSSDAVSNPESLNLGGIRILVVEDSWQLGTAVTDLLKELGAEVLGPVATTADAQGLASAQRPDAAFVDFNLRDGELANGLVDWLYEQGIHVVVITGYAVLPAPPRHAVVILQKPLSEAALLGSLRPMLARRTQG
jgi:DNA-binding response OmpR family regulator